MQKAKYFINIVFGSRIYAISNRKTDINEVNKAKASVETVVVI
jgi:hypothetical protein